MSQWTDLSCGACGTPDMRLQQSGGLLRAICQGCGSVTRIRASPPPCVTLSWGVRSEGEIDAGILCRMDWRDR